MHFEQKLRAALRDGAEAYAAIRQSANRHLKIRTKRGSK